FFRPSLPAVVVLRPLLSLPCPPRLSSAWSFGASYKCAQPRLFHPRALRKAAPSTCDSSVNQVCLPARFYPQPRCTSSSSSYSSPLPLHATHTRPPMHPQAPQRTRNRYQEADSDSDSDHTMVPGTSSARKKPVCHACGTPMAGHKRPNGSPICPRASASPLPSRSRPASKTPARHSAEPPSLLSRLGPSPQDPDVSFSPTPSGFWHRKNPHWVDPEHYARIPTHAVHTVPRRGETLASWNSTELDESAAAASIYGDRVSPSSHGSEQEEGEYVPSDGEDGSSQRTLSPTPSSGSFSTLRRGLSKILGRGTALASVYAAPSDEVVAIEHAAHERGLTTAAVRRHPLVKAEPPSPSSRLDDASSSTLARDKSWLVYVGRDPSAVNALAASHGAPPPEREPYDFDTGLVAERNERVGTYPVDPRAIRQNYCDVIIAAVVSAFCAVWFLSWM
ncbi:hypothetical protein BV20DRAFT_27983, partial [Pilatotrama ljubarskyi]